MSGTERSNVLVVGPLGAHVDLMRRIAERIGFNPIFIEAAEMAPVLEFLEPAPELILLDASAPNYEPAAVCQPLLHNLKTRFTPILFFNAPTTPTFALAAFNAGAQDLLTAPFEPTLAYVRIRLHKQLQAQRRQLASVIAQRTREVQLSSAEMVRRLRAAAEFKDDETGTHCERLSHMARLLSIAAGLTPQEAELIALAIPLHDIGHIGIPERILFKASALTPEEWRIVRMHPGIGAAIIGKHEAPVLKIARRIALSHHEKWDGSGYPRGLAGEDIPLVARITALCDSFDVLTSERPHKPAWPVDHAIQYLRDQAGKHFDPRLTQVFLNQLPAIAKIRQDYPEKPAMLFDLKAKVSETLV